MSSIRKENFTGDPNMCACIDLCTVDNRINMDAFEITVSILNRYNEAIDSSDEKSSCLITDLATLDLMGIDGDRIVTLYEVCGKNLDQLETVLSMMAFEVFDSKDILANLDGPKVPFIDSSIKGEDENGRFGPNSLGWAEWCNRQMESFIKRLRSAESTDK